MFAPDKSLQIGMRTRFLAIVFATIYLLCAELTAEDPHEYYLNYDQPTYCGNAAHKVPYIAGGDEVIPGEFPSLVLVQTSIGVCSGVIYRSDVVLTASHCFNAIAPGWTQKFALGSGQQVVVITGMTDIRQRFLPVTRYEVGYVIRGDGIGPDYIEATDPDFARLILKQPISFNEYTQPACVLRDNAYYYKLTTFGTCYQVGFGIMHTRLVEDASGGSAEIPQYPRAAQKLRVVPVACTKQFAENPDCYGPHLRDHVDRGGCPGDSGGPVLCTGQDGRHTVVAIHVGSTVNKESEGKCLAGQQSRTDRNLPDLFTGLLRLTHLMEYGLEEGRRAIQRARRRRN